MEPKMRDISFKMTLKDEKVQPFISLRIPSPMSYSKSRNQSPKHKHSSSFSLFKKEPKIQINKNTPDYASSFLFKIIYSEGAEVFNLMEFPN